MTAGTLLAALFVGTQTMAENLPDIRSIQPDLVTPPMTVGEPAPGKRVRQVLPEYAGTDVHHALYLPTDWRPGERYPVLVEYAGNGPYRNKHGDTCTGKVADCNLGYGLSGGKGFVWVCVPYVSQDRKENQLQWWGDVEATVDYCKKTVRLVCKQYGGDPTKVVLCGFSRGAIACNYLGLHDDEIAGLWCAFVAHSHYDGVRTWGYPADDRASALGRLRRLKGRPQWLSQEGSVGQTEAYLKSTGVEAPFTFVPLPYRNHTDSWVLRDLPERRRLREWLGAVFERKEEPR
jgi:hypothetical protein